MAADRQLPFAVRQSLVRLGHLCFDDFLLLSAETLDIGHWTPDLTADLALATNNAPTVQLHFRRSTNLQSAILRSCHSERSEESSVPAQDDVCNLQSAGAHPRPSASSIASAQARLVTAFAYELLRAKAPPLYDALPWQEWDFSIVAKRFRLWQTRFLLAGDGTTVTMCRCRKSAGVYVVEPNPAIAVYIERKAALEKVRRFRLLRSAASFPGPPSLTPIPLSDHSVDLAIVGSSAELQPANCKLVTQELLRVSTNVLLIENSPLSEPLDEEQLTDSGFLPASVAVSGLGPRRCWWHVSGTRSPA